MTRDDRPAGHRVRVALAGVALVLASVALVVGGDGAAADAGIEPLALAQRIRDREPGLRILDVMGDAFDPAISVPTAIRVDPDSPANWPLDPAATVVVYGVDEEASVAARDAARTAGRPDARHLAGGLAGWVDDVLETVLPAPVTAADSAANEEIAELSRYFGGLPRIAVPGEEGVEDAAARVKRAARRGCGPGF